MFWQSSLSLGLALIAANPFCGATPTASHPPSLPTLAPVRHANTSVLSIEYYDSAPHNSKAPVAILVHGFPYSIDTYIDVVPKLVDQATAS